MIAAVLLVAVQAGPPAPVEERRQTVSVRWDVETKSCVPTVRGVDTGDVQSESGRMALVAALPDKGAPLRVAGTDGVPYECAADMIQALKRGGYWGPISYSSQPPGAR